MTYRHTDRSEPTAGLLEFPATGIRLSVGDDIDHQDRFRGAMIGTGIGDALGRPAEGMSPNSIESAYGRITDYIPWRDWEGGPTGTVTDDTEMALCIAECIVENGALDMHDLAQRFAAWVRVGRGVGSATWAACDRIQSGAPWYESGSASAGNGAAMRAAPIGLAAPFDVDELRRIAARSAIVTHADPTAVLSTVVMSFTVAYLLNTPAGELDLDHLRASLGEAVGGLEDPSLPERSRPDSSVTLMERIDQVFEMRDRPVDEIYQLTHNGAFVTESLPAALGAFIVHRDDPQAAVLAAVHGGYDADTVAAMTGAFVGAYHGMSAFPVRWIDGLEFRSGLAGLADDLLIRAELPVAGHPLPVEPAEIRYEPTEIGGQRWITHTHRYAASKLPVAQVSGVRLQPHPNGARRFGAFLEQTGDRFA